jgi:hypothetical protein
MLQHRIRKRNGRRYILAKVTWLTDHPTWIDMHALRTQEPFLILEYVSHHPILLRSRDFQWANEYIEERSKLATMACAFHAKVNRTPKFKFGV